MNKPVFWFLTGSQHLYGPEALREVEAHSKIVVEALNKSEFIEFPVEYKPILTTPDEIARMLGAANADAECVGVITWMHTFSPAKMWIAGLSSLQKPLLHLHTQFNRDIPFDTIDMDFMNLNQSAHGDREYGFIGSRMKVARKVVAGHYEDEEVRRRIGWWMRTAVAWDASRRLKVARFGDNMRNVAVTEGDKVEAQIKFGWAIDGYGVGDLADRVAKVTDEEVARALSQYEELYDIAPSVRGDAARWGAVAGQARIEIALRGFLDEGGYGAFTTTFEDLHGIEQLPGLAAQRLMGSGYGFAGEGDWKTAAFVRVMKVMAGFEGTSFMEDYTYHWEPGNEMILGSHMLEVCPTIAGDKPKIEVHPLSIGGKADPARLTFNGHAGKAVCATIVDLGTRFRMIVSEVEAVEPTHAMPKLPVARVLWKPQPSMREATEGWIYAGGAHHTVFSYRVTSEQLIDFAEMAGIECVVIGEGTTLQGLKNELRWNDLAYRLM